MDFIPFHEKIITISKILKQKLQFNPQLNGQRYGRMLAILLNSRIKMFLELH